LPSPRKDIIFEIQDYNSNQLNVFDNFLSDVTLLNNIKSKVTSLKSCYSKKTINKDQDIIYKSEIENEMYIGNSIENGIKSSLFNYGTSVCYFADDSNGNVFIYKESDNQKLLVKSFGRVDYTNGIIYYQFPVYGTLVQNNYGSSGTINFTMTPTNPDIETYLQNIVRITKIRVILSNA